MNTKQLFLCYFFITGIVVCQAQKRDTTLIIKDSLTGNIKTLHYLLEGVNYGMEGGQTAKYLQRFITIHNSAGKLIYTSELSTVMRGCIRDYKRYQVKSTAPDGSYKTLVMKKKGFETRTYDKSGKLLSLKKDKYLYAHWLDKEENRFYP